MGYFKPLDKTFTVKSVNLDNPKPAWVNMCLSEGPRFYESPEGTWGF